MNTSTKDLMAGLFWGGIAIIVLSGSLVMMRLGVKTSLSPFDLAALRFGIASMLLLGVIWRRGWALEKLGVLGVLCLITCNGAPYIMILSFGFEFAPASDAGAINPGLMAVFVGILGWIVLKEDMRAPKIAGILAVLAGTALFTDILTLRQASFGHIIFATTGGMWASYVIIVRKTNLPALHATAIVAVGSALSFLPVYVVFFGGQILQAPARDIAAQAIYQGVFTGALAVFAFTKSTEYLGASSGAALTALIPIVTLVMGAVFLEEPIDGWKIIACILVGLGVFLTLYAQRSSVARKGAQDNKEANDATLPIHKKIGRITPMINPRVNKGQLLKPLLLILLGLLWSVRLSAIKAAGLSGIPVHVVVTFAALGIALFFSIFALIRHDWPPIDRHALGFYVLSGLLGFLAPFALEATVGPHLPVFVFVIIIATMPLFTLGLSALTGQERLRLGPMIAITLGFFGAVAILWDISLDASSTEVSTGWVVVAFGVPLLYALNTVFVASRWPSHASPVNVAQAQALIIAVAALTGSATSGAMDSWLLITLNVPALLLIVSGEGLALVVYLRITRDYGANYVSFANYASIVFAALIGMVWFEDQLTALTLGATVAIVGSVVIYQRYSGKSEKVSATSKVRMHRNG